MPTAARRSGKTTETDAEVVGARSRDATPDGCVDDATAHDEAASSDRGGRDMEPQIEDDGAALGRRDVSRGAKNVQPAIVVDAAANVSVLWPQM